MLAPTVARKHNKKLLHRFYEPLVLLYVLDPTQGEHLRRPTLEIVDHYDSSLRELRRRYLDAISYVCDFEKGGDTTTAIIITSAPLTYYVGCNKNPKKKVIPFLGSLIRQLAMVPVDDENALAVYKSSVLKACATFSTERLESYRELLMRTLTSCLAGNNEGSIFKELDNLRRGIVRASGSLDGLCTFCDQLMRSNKLDFVKEKIKQSEQQANQYCRFSDLRHYIGRLAFHVRTVDILIIAATRLPALFEEPEFKIIERPLLRETPSQLRKRADLSGIANRMIGNNDSLLRDVQSRLAQLDRMLEIENLVRREYEDKRFKPCIHAELLVLEYFYRNRGHLTPIDNDKFIGCSKPACYCCALYIREHPGGFEQPASHQKIYLNWIPPTGVDPTSSNAAESTVHESRMLNKMVQSIRKSTIEQIKNRTKLRPKQFDSVTGDTLSELIKLQLRLNDDDDGENETTPVPDDYQMLLDGLSPQTSQEDDEDDDIIKSEDTPRPSLTFDKMVNVPQAKTLYEMLTVKQRPTPVDKVVKVSVIDQDSDSEGGVELL